MESPKKTHRIWIPWMKRALHLASLAEGYTSPNPLVGAIILNSEGKLIGEGFHSCAGNPHAEIEAINRCKGNINGGTLIVTLEPCCHEGRTPPCTKALIESGIKRVVIAIQDPDPRVSGKGIKILREAGIEVISGVLKKEAEYQNRAFIFRTQTGRPWGILKWAMSIDGRIALPNGESKWISSQPARNWVYSLRSKCDAIIIGGGTLRSDNPLLTSRGIRNNEPLRVVMTCNLDLPKQAKLWDTSVANTLIAYQNSTSKELLRKLPEEPERIALEENKPINLMKALSKKGCNIVLWECGSKLATAAIKDECVQELFVILAPKILGGIPGNTPLNELGFTSMSQVLTLPNGKLKKIGEDWLINSTHLSSKY